MLRGVALCLGFVLTASIASASTASDDANAYASSPSLHLKMVCRSSSTSDSPLAFLSSSSLCSNHFESWMCHKAAAKKTDQDQSCTPFIADDDWNKAEEEARGDEEGSEMKVEMGLCEELVQETGPLMDMVVAVTCADAGTQWLSLSSEGTFQIDRKSLTSECKVVWVTQSGRSGCKQITAPLVSSVQSDTAPTDKRTFSPQDNHHQQQNLHLPDLTAGIQTFSNSFFFQVNGMFGNSSNSNSTKGNSSPAGRRVAAIVVPMLLTIPFIVHALAHRGKKIPVPVYLNVLGFSLWISCVISMGCGAVVVDDRYDDNEKPFDTANLRFVMALDVLMTAWLSIALLAEMCASGASLVQALLVELFFGSFVTGGSVINFVFFNGNKNFCNYHDSEACHIYQTSITFFWLCSCLFICKAAFTIRYIRYVENSKQAKNKRFQQKHHLQQPSQVTNQYGTTSSNMVYNSNHTYNSMSSIGPGGTIDPKNIRSQTQGLLDVPREGASGAGVVKNSKVWQKHFDPESNKDFYFNPLTGESLWDKPTDDL